MRVLVCGGRDYTNKTNVYEVLDQFFPDVTMIISGGARGADTLGQEWAKDRRIPLQVYMANWERDGKKAGPLRNIQMLAEGKPDWVVAFPGGKGTAHMMLISRKAGVPVMEITDGS